MRSHDMMKDRRLAGHLFRIESVFIATDFHAEKEGIVLGDAAIRTLLVKAINQADGREPKPSTGKLSAKESLLEEAFRSLLAVRPKLTVLLEKDGQLVDTEEPISKQTWVGLLTCIKQSVELRGDGLPGSRGYLTFMREFAEKARGVALN